MGCQRVGCLGSETWKERGTTLPFAKIKLYEGERNNRNQVILVHGESSYMTNSFDAHPLAGLCIWGCSCNAFPNGAQSPFISSIGIPPKSSGTLKEGPEKKRGEKALNTTHLQCWFREDRDPSQGSSWEGPKEIKFLHFHLKDVNSSSGPLQMTRLIVNLAASGIPRRQVSKHIILNNPCEGSLD